VQFFLEHPVYVYFDNFVYVFFYISSLIGFRKSFTFRPPVEFCTLSGWHLFHMIRFCVREHESNLNLVVATVLILTVHIVTVS